MPRIIVQPHGSALCGQCCVAMAAGVSLERAIEVLGESRSGTTTKQIVQALRYFGVQCADRPRRISRAKPVWPERAILTIHRPKEEEVGRRSLYHWMLAWDGKILDPGKAWPDRYEKWRITSHLEIYKP